ncbi:MAG: phage tail protein [Flavicella sp.]
MKKIFYSCILLFVFSQYSPLYAQDAFIGEIKMFAGNFAPRNWAFCNGQLLPISQNTALFSLLGTTYGGDGRTTFALPDLRGRVAVHAGSGPGLSSKSLGQKGGQETVLLMESNLPSHNHSIKAVAADGNTSNPEGALLAGTKILDGEYSKSTSDITMSSDMVGVTGGNQPIQNTQPFSVVNYVICLQGIYPSRN